MTLRILLFASILLLIASRVDAAPCRWDTPARDAYTGSISDALARYPELPPDARAEIMRKVDAHLYDDHVVMHADGTIEGNWQYTNPRDMHFGAGRVCRGPVAWRWSEGRTERALSYTSGRWTVLYMEACRNVTLVDRGDRIDRLPSRAVERLSGGGGSGWAPMLTSVDAATGREVPRWPPGGWNDDVQTWHPPIPITNVVPEPSTLWLVGLGVAVLAWRARKCR